MEHCANGSGRAFTGLVIILLVACQSRVGVAVKQGEEVMSRLDVCIPMGIDVLQASYQDILPGMESNVRKQRFYVVKTNVNLKEGAQTISEWELWTDSVRIPLTWLADEGTSGALKGSRVFYGPVRSGVPILEEDVWRDHGQHLNGNSWLVGRHSSGNCAARILPDWTVLPIIASP